MFGIRRALNHAALRQGGVLIRESFLTAVECEAIRSEARSANEQKAQVGNVSEAPDGKTYEQVRSTKIAALSSERLHALEQKIMAIKPELEEKFEFSLTACSGTSLLVYREGDHFQWHSDRPVREDAGAPEHVAARRVSVILFLSSYAKKASGHEAFSGGELWFRGFPGGEKAAAHIHPGLGMLVAFDSRLQHQVSPVAAGVRYALVSWLR